MKHYNSPTRMRQSTINSSNIYNLINSYSSKYKESQSSARIYQVPSYPWPWSSVNGHTPQANEVIQGQLMKHYFTPTRRYLPEYHQLHDALIWINDNFFSFCSDIVSTFVCTQVRVAAVVTSLSAVTPSPQPHRPLLYLDFRFREILVFREIQLWHPAPCRATQTLLVFEFEILGNSSILRNTLDFEFWIRLESSSLKLAPRSILWNLTIHWYLWTLSNVFSVLNIWLSFFSSRVTS